MSKTWHSVEITVRPEAVEAIEFAFNSLEASGTSTGFHKVGEVREVTVSGFFETLPDGETVQDEIHYALRIYGCGEEALLSAGRAAVENQDWLAEWKKHWRPTRIGRFIVAPPWAEVPDSDAVVIRIEPNMAFGTGTHETTQLCISAIDRFYAPGDSFLDIGTGTGILAIAAAKLGDESEKISACDTDEDSVAIARENAAANGVDRIEFAVGPIDPDTPVFDFVCANLTVDVIVPILKLLIEKTNKILVLAGILREQEGIITDALDTLNVTDFEIEWSGEWVAVILRRR